MRALTSRVLSAICQCLVEKGGGGVGKTTACATGGLPQLPHPTTSTHKLGAGCSISMVLAWESTLASSCAERMSPTTHFSASSSDMRTCPAKSLRAAGGKGRQRTHSMDLVPLTRTHRRSIFWCTRQ